MLREKFWINIGFLRAPTTELTGKLDPSSDVAFRYLSIHENDNYKITALRPIEQGTFSDRFACVFHVVTF